MTPSADEPSARVSDPATFAGRRCLVTGGLGFIGSNLALALVDVGADVVVVDASYPRHGANERNLDAPGGDRIEVVRAPIDDPVVREIAADLDFVFNLAGQVSHIDSMTHPVFDLDVNTRSHLGFLESLLAVNPEVGIVFTSTRQLYGHPTYLPVDEEHPVRPVDINGVTKFATEQLHFLYGELYGLRPSVLRLTNVFGPRQRLRDDLQGFLPVFISRALMDEPISVFGEGQQRRDCLFVDDVVDCLLRTAASPDAVGEVFNVGNDETLSVREIAETVLEVAGLGSLKVVPWPPERDAIDIGSYYADAGKAKRMLGWEPRTSFRDGVTKTIDFYREHADWYL